MILVRIRNVRRHSADMVRRCPVSQVSKNIPKYVQLKVAVTRDKTQGKNLLTCLTVNLKTISPCSC